MGFLQESAIYTYSHPCLAAMAMQKIFAREILDSRGNPTVEVDLYTAKGNHGLTLLVRLDSLLQFPPPLPHNFAISFTFSEIPVPRRLPRPSSFHLVTMLEEAVAFVLPPVSGLGEDTLAHVG